jgi:hypothetical protein
VDHYVQKYAPMISSETLSRAVGSTPSLRMVQPLMHAHG